MVRALSPELAEIAKKEINENPKQILNDLNQLKEWISKQHHLRARTDDQWLLGLLRGCKFSLEKVKSKIELYYTLRTSAPEITMKLKPSQQEFMDFLRIGTVVILPKPKVGLIPRMVLIRPGVYDPRVHSVADVMCTLYYLVQILLIEDDTSTVIGTKVLVDYEGVTVHHMTQANPSLLRKMIAVGQADTALVNVKEATPSVRKPYGGRPWRRTGKKLIKDSMPLRLRGSHHFNLPLGVEVIFSLISGFLNEKAKDRLCIHKEVDELFEFIPKEIIPAEYGGNGPTVQQLVGQWIFKVAQYKNWMQEEESFGCDESKRLKISNSEVVGSFRSLDID